MGDGFSMLTNRFNWTFVPDPTPRWAALRNSVELRPYNSLPRGQDINNYPSLALHQANLRNTDSSIEALRRSPARRAKSEDVYTERNVPAADATAGDCAICKCFQFWYGSFLKWKIQAQKKNGSENWQWGFASLLF